MEEAKALLTTPLILLIPAFIRQHQFFELLPLGFVPELLCPSVDCDRSINRHMNIMRLYSQGRQVSIWVFC